MVAAALQHPDRLIVCFAGDGCFQMTLDEMSTAQQYGVAPIVLVCDNGRYGTIRMHQERAFPTRVSGTDLKNPDFAALARAYGGHGETVENGAEFPAAFERARMSGRLAVVGLRLDPRTLSTSTGLSGPRHSGGMIGVGNERSGRYAEAAHPVMKSAPNSVWLHENGGRGHRMGCLLSGWRTYPVAGTGMSGAPFRDFPGHGGGRHWTASGITP